MPATEVLIVTAFVATMGTATFYEPEDVGKNGARVSIGQTQGYVKEQTLSAGIEHNKWEANYTVQGNRNEETAEGNTRMYSITRVIRPAWGTPEVQPVFKIGPAYVTNSPFVGRENMHLAFGLEVYDKLSLTWDHYSSGGVSRPNSGIENLKLTYLIEW